MPRKLLGYRVERNGNSLKVFKLGEYVGSIGVDQIGMLLETIKNR